MFQTADEFFTSLGFEPLPEQFYEKSMLVNTLFLDKHFIIIFKGYTVERMFQTADEFFTSLGLEPLSDQFRNRCSSNLYLFFILNEYLLWFFMKGYTVERMFKLPTNVLLLLVSSPFQISSMTNPCLSTSNHAIFPQINISFPFFVFRDTQ